MGNIWAIEKRELKAYFDSPIAYMVVVAFLLIAGWIFFSQLFLMGRADARIMFTPSPFSASFVLVFMAPVITMRLVAEERKTGTIELLTTMPVTDTQVILGKFFAAFDLILIALALTLAYPITVSFLGDLDWGPVISGYVGLVLFSATLLAIGILCSTLTDSQIVSVILAFIIGAILYYIHWLQFFMPPAISDLTQFISVGYHLENLARGVIDSRDVVYYLSTTAGALFLSVLSLSRQHA